MQRTFSVTWTADTYAALAAPERIDALVLALPPTAWEMWAAQADPYENLARLVETEGLASRVALLKQHPLLPPFLLQALPTLEELSLQHVAALQERIVPALLRGAGLSNFSPRDAIQTLMMPALILVWADDPVHPVSTPTELGRLLPQAGLHLASSLEEIQAWPDVLRHFVRQLA